MFDLLMHATNEIDSDSSLAAVASFHKRATAGKMMILHELTAYHDDPAGATLAWLLINYNDTKSVTIPIGVTASGVRVRLGAYTTLPRLFAPGQGVRILASAALAAGCKFYLEWHRSCVKGVIGGTYE